MCMMIDTGKMVPLCFYFQPLTALHYHCKQFTPGMKKKQEEFLPFDEISTCDVKSTESVLRVVPRVDVWMLGQSFHRIFG